MLNFACRQPFSNSSNPSHKWTGSTWRAGYAILITKQIEEEIRTFPIDFISPMEFNGVAEGS